MEDLLRLCRFLPYTEAIRAWRLHEGDEVRKYALEREIEMLTESSGELLRVCALADRPLTLLELERITGRSTESTMASVDCVSGRYFFEK